VRTPVILSLIVLAALLLAACSAATTPTPIPPTPIPATQAAPAAAAVPPTPAPAATEPPVATAVPPAPAATEPPVATAAATVQLDPAAGQQIWQSKPCSGCHGPNAEGKIGPALAGTGLTFDAVLLRVRAGKGPMPAFTTDQVSDLEVQQIYTWLRSLPPPAPTAAPTDTATVAPTVEATSPAVATTAPAPPAAATKAAPVAVRPTPIPPPNYPTGALTAFWASVNDLKVKSDFTKDLPARQAQDDAGRLAILKQYAGQAVGLGQNALAQGNQALGEVTNENVKADLRQALSAVQQIVDQANQAQGQSSYGAAYGNAGDMTRLSRIEALPWATQAVRDAGLTGTVRVRVTNQAGKPIPGAFVTVLTARNPVGAQTDGSGRVTIPNVAAVPALQVKAYGAKLVYHEEHANLAPGATADTTIVLPNASVPGQTPAVAGAAVTPASGSGDATVIFRMRATDPQGAQDLAEDQLFALNPVLGVAYVLQAAGGDQYQFQVQLPGLGAGEHTWYLFAVDHECNTSSVLPVQYVVQ
jgi:mono/diheme cytochrome c family protein